MSKFTGKSDFYDWVFMHNSPEEFLKNGEVWITTRSGDIKVDIKDEKDLFLLGTHILRSANTSKERQIVVLCEKSYIDYKELESISTYVRFSIDFLKKFKRTHTEKENPARALFEYLRTVFPYEAAITFEKLSKSCVVHENNGDYRILPTILKTPRSVLKDERFILYYLIPKYFYWLHTQTATNARKEFLQEAKEKYNLVSKDEPFPRSVLQDMQYKYDDFFEAASDI